MTRMKRIRHLLLAGCGVVSAPALAQSAPAAAPAPAPAPVSARGAPAPATGGTTADKPLSPNSGSLVSLYGPATGMAGFIRGFEGDASANAGFIRGFEGDAQTRAGFIRGFAGNIRGFAGFIRGFDADVARKPGITSAFWGSLKPQAGSLSADAGFIRGFNGDFEAQAGFIRGFSGSLRDQAGFIRGFNDAPGDYASLITQVRALVTSSQATWGKAVEARSGKSFDAAITNPLLTKYGIDLNDPSSFKLDELGVELFLLDWYDNLMVYSGHDSVDHWMPAIHWSPAITQSLGAGFDSKVGLLDFSITGDELSNVVKSSGISTVAGGHGTAVVSLIVGAHDGQGVMGIAPRASVVSYNPFDATNTAGWKDIENGVKYLADQKATVINMSLGVPGWALHPGWNSVFSNDAVSKEAKKRVFVLSAGNDGVAQTQNVEWDFKKNPSIIVVGSVDPNGKISSFSNQPGTACLTRNSVCAGPADLLMNRFLVAPGEMILVSNGQGGVTRMSGTSFSAPLVSGAIALIHDRWPWLASRPEDTASIILNTARDLGAPGVDPVYGHGMLDVEAAMSPVNWNFVDWKISIDGKKTQDVKAAMLSGPVEGLRSQWEAAGAYIIAFDETETSFRDFAIPLSSKLVGQTVGKNKDQFLSYLQSRFWDWLGTQGAPSTSAGKRLSAFSDAGPAVPMAGFGEWRATLSLAPRADRAGLRQGIVPIESSLAVRSPDGRIGFTVGQGDGARRIGGQAGFDLASDYALGSGGVNPLFGFASGGAFGRVEYGLGRRLVVSAAVSEQATKRDGRDLAGDDGRLLRGLDPYRATAAMVTARFDVSKRFSASVGYTLLDEATGLLGTQSLDRSDFRNGARTDAVTVNTKLTLGSSLDLAASATLGRTRAGDLGQQNIAVSRGGLINSAYQLSVDKAGLFDRHDRARISVAQTLHLEGGSIDVAGTEVVDRLTGELGTVVQTVALQSGARQHVVEALYGRSLLGGAAELSLFGRARLGHDASRAQRPETTAGFSVRTRF